MKTSDFCAAIEAAFLRAYDNETCALTVPYADNGEIKECLGFLLTKSEHFAVVVAHAAHWIAEDPDGRWDPHESEAEDMLDRLEDFYNLVGGMRVAPYMQWSCVYFPGLTQQQIDSEEN